MEFPVKVAVIGAGAAGLCVARHLLANSEHFQFDVFEKKHYIGGLWNYYGNAGHDEYGMPIESSIYNNLTTNIPKEAMAFPDFPFPHYGGRSYIHHTQVLQYLKDYAEHFGLHEHIKFHKMVVHVRPLKLSDGRIEWCVTYSDVLTKEEDTKIYNAVIVCNGRYSVPSVPDIKGLRDFQGVVLHSQDYRENTMFKDQKVIILGSGPSGEDIGFEIAEVAKEVILSHNAKLKTCSLPNNMVQRKGVDHVNKSSVTFVDGQTYECDAIVLCTGYLVDYPFLDPSCNVQIHDQRITPFYLHTFHIDYPSLAILAITKYALPFLVYEQQVKVFLKYLKREIALPSPDKMREEEERDFKSRLAEGLKPSHAHILLNERLWKFDDELCRIGQIEPIPNSIRHLINHVINQRDVNLMKYREKNYSLVGSETYVEVDENSDQV